jgi:hypothetical protein
VSYMTFGDSLVMLLRCTPGTPLHAIARSAARRVVTELYYAECREAQKRRDKWLAIINRDSGT